MLQVMGTLLIPVLVAVAPFIWKAVEGLTPKPRLARRIEWMQKVLAELPEGSTKQDLAAEIDRSVARYLDLSTDRLNKEAARPPATRPSDLALRQKYRRQSTQAQIGSLIGVGLGAVAVGISLLLPILQGPDLDTLSAVELSELAKSARGAGDSAMEMRARQELYERCYYSLVPECYGYPPPGP